jgi:tRNA-binding protein
MAPRSERPPKAQITSGKFANVDLRVARVLAAPHAEGTAAPCRVLRLDLGHLGERTSVGQYALLEEEELVGRNVVACINLGTRQISAYESQALVLGAPHPASPADQAQATPLFVADDTCPGDEIF